MGGWYAADVEHCRLRLRSFREIAARTIPPAQPERVAPAKNAGLYGGLTTERLSARELKSSHTVAISTASRKRILQAPEAPGISSGTSTQYSVVVQVSRKKYVAHVENVAQGTRTGSAGDNRIVSGTFNTLWLSRLRLQNA